MRGRKRKTDQAAAVFAALGEPRRLEIVARLQAGAPLAIVDLADGADVSRQAVAKHLQVLHRAGIVRVERIGRESRYSLESKAFHDARAYLDEVTAHWDGALARLRDFVED